MPKKTPFPVVNNFKITFKLDANPKITFYFGRFKKKVDYNVDNAAHFTAACQLLSANTPVMFNPRTDQVIVDTLLFANRTRGERDEGDDELAIEWTEAAQEEEDAQENAD